MEKRVLLINEFGNNIFTRNTISSFMENIETLKEDKIVLDFKGIEFISRSCADEYAKKKNKSSKIIKEENLSKDVSSMFNVVRSQYKDLGLSFSVMSPILVA